jgi:hypothetical protein
LKLNRDTVSTGNIVKIWDKYFFKKDNDKLAYFPDDHDPNRVGALDFSSMTFVDISKKDEKIFKIYTKSRNFEFLAETPGIAIQWVKAIREWKSGSASLLLEEVQEFKEVQKKREEEDKNVCINGT